VAVQTRGKDDGRVREGAGTGGALAAPAARGFSAQLRGVGLWDLVQMECLARSRLCVQVVGEGGVGYLYFDRGQIVHAATAHHVGEPAALEILGWTNGSFQPTDRGWPEQPTIITSHEALLLQVAQRRDETGSSNLVAFPGRGGTVEGPVAGEATFEEIELTEVPEEGEGDMPGSTSDGIIAATKNARADSRELRGENAGDFSVVLRLGPTGAIINNRGGDDALAETIAYVHRLLELAGELLGLESFSALECTFVEGRCLVFSEGAGEVVALRPRAEANLQALRERLGL
jgi:hypothetical protein